MAQCTTADLPERVHATLPTVIKPLHKVRRIPDAGAVQDNAAAGRRCARTGKPKKKK
jgi:hypothetical protein